MVRACPECLARAWLLGELAGHLDAGVADIEAVLALDDRELLGAVGGRRRQAIEHKLARLRPMDAVDQIDHAGLDAICRCEGAYPDRLRDLASAPAVLHVLGGLDRLSALTGTQAVALVGSRRATPYGLQVASWLGRTLAGTGVVVVSGMAIGVDTAAHEGALVTDGETLAVLPGSADQPYPPSRRALHKRIAARGVVVSELPPGTRPRRWMFPARNRIIAALSGATVVVEAGSDSGALLTARYARSLGRPLGAVPGRVTTDHAAGCHALLAQGERLICGPEDVLELLFGSAARQPMKDTRPALDQAQRAVLHAVAAGDDTLDALPTGALASLALLELAGYVRCEAGGRYTVVP